MTDEDVVAQAARLMGATYHPTTPTRSGKPVFQMQIPGRRGIAWMMTLYTFLKARRRERIRFVIKLWRSIPVNKQYRAWSKRMGRV